ncbi:transposase, partial [Rhodobacteraceae bacterium]|nr:transposase [Paracoccaceae bacterium]
MHRAYKYRLYPTEEQAARLNQSFAAVRWVYNAALEQRNMYFRSKKDGPDYWGRPTNFNQMGQKKEINFKASHGFGGLENDDELSWISETYKMCLVEGLRDLDKAFDAFSNAVERYKKGLTPKVLVGYPKFRSADKSNNLKYEGLKNNKPVLVFRQNCVSIPKIGKVRYKRHKKFYGKPASYQVVREGKEFYVIFVTVHKFKTIKHKGPAVGLDLGVTLPVCLSNGEAIAPDLGLEVLEQKARKAQKRLSRAKRGSQRRKQTKQHLADIKRKQARRRTARTHVITTELTRRFSFIAIEDLKLKNMTGSAKGDAE